MTFLRVELEAESVAELHKVMRAFLGDVHVHVQDAQPPAHPHPSPVSPMYPVDDGSHTVTVTEIPAEPVSEKKRSRRPKAEIEADNAKTAEVLAVQTGGPVPCDEAKKDDLEIPAFLKRDAAPTTPAKPLTIEDLRASLSKLIAAKDGKTVFATLANFSGADGKPCQKASQVQAGDYALVIAACEAAAA